MGIGKMRCHIWSGITQKGTHSKYLAPPFHLFKCLPNSVIQNDSDNSVSTCDSLTTPTWSCFLFLSGPEWLRTYFIYFCSLLQKVLSSLILNLSLCFLFSSYFFFTSCFLPVRFIHLGSWNLELGRTPHPHYLWYCIHNLWVGNKSEKANIYTVVVSIVS